LNINIVEEVDDQWNAVCQKLPGFFCYK